MPSTHSSEMLFSQWLATHRGIVVKVSRSFAPEPADQHDLMQEMLFHLWKSLSRFRGDAKPSTWIYRICLNTALQWRRTTERRESRIEPDADLAALAGDGVSPAESAAQRELLDRLYAAIRALAASDRSLMLLSRDGLSYQEMADVTGLTENHVGVALTRARQRLAALMKGVSHELE